MNNFLKKHVIISVKSAQETQSIKRAKVYPLCRVGKNCDQIAFRREGNSKLNIIQES